MSYLNKNDARLEIKKAESKFAEFLNAVHQSGNYIPLEGFKSVKEEIENFNNACINDKVSLIQKYYKNYECKGIKESDMALLAKANMSTLTSKFVFMGVPTRVKGMEEKPVPVKPTNFYSQAAPYISELRTMKNLDKCEYRGQPLSTLLNNIQFSNGQKCSEKEFEVIKKANENLKRYNHALEIIGELETKAFKIDYQNDFGFKVAQTIKNSKGICSESQLKILEATKDKTIGKETVQVDMFSMLREESQKKDYGMDR